MKALQTLKEILSLPSRIPSADAIQNSSREQSAAEVIVHRHNPKMMLHVSKAKNRLHGLEDYSDTDGRLYRLEYISTLNGKHALGYVRHNPWSPSDPSAGLADYQVHVYPNGAICLGKGFHTRKEYANSPFDMDYVIKRSRLWTNCFSYYQGAGRWPKGL